MRLKIQFLAQTEQTLSLAQTNLLIMFMDVISTDIHNIAEQRRRHSADKIKQIVYSSRWGLTR
jgi:hypothetical protein